MLVLVWAGRGGDEDRLVEVMLELVERQRAVVQRRGQAEAVVHQHLLARAVAVEHAAHLRQRDMRLVHHQQEVVGHVVEQRPGRLAGLAAGEVARVVLDAGADARLAQHLHVEVGALAQARRLQQLALALQLLQPHRQLLLDVGDGARSAVPAS